MRAVIVALALAGCAAPAEDLDPTVPPPAGDFLEYAECRGVDVVVYVDEGYADPLPSGWRAGYANGVDEIAGLPRMAAGGKECASLSTDGIASGGLTHFFRWFQVEPTEPFRASGVDRYLLVLAWVTTSAAEVTALGAPAEFGDVRIATDLDVPAGPRIARVSADTGEEVLLRSVAATPEGEGAPIGPGTDRLIFVRDGVVLAAFDRTVTVPISLENRHGPSGSFRERDGTAREAYAGGDGYYSEIVMTRVELPEGGVT